MSTHTRGPWTLIMGIGDDGWSAIDADSNTVVEEITNRRDANLVVAAPDMYKALKFCTHFMQAFLGGSVEWGSEDQKATWMREYEKVLAAVAKAEGRLS